MGNAVAGNQKERESLMSNNRNYDLCWNSFISRDNGAGARQTVNFEDNNKMCILTLKPKTVTKNTHKYSLKMCDFTQKIRIDLRTSKIQNELNGNYQISMLNMLMIRIQQ